MNSYLKEETIQKDKYSASWVRQKPDKKNKWKAWRIREIYFGRREKDSIIGRRINKGENYEKQKQWKNVQMASSALPFITQL